MTMEVEQQRPAAVAAGDHADRAASGSKSALHESFKAALGYGLTTPTLSEFQRHFPGLAPSVVDALYDTFNQMLALVRYNCQAEFQDICKEYGVEQFVGALEQSAAAHSVDHVHVTSAPSSRVDPAAAVQASEAAARMEAMQAEAERLQDLLERATTQQDRLRDALSMRQGHVDKALLNYSNAVTDVKQVYDVARAWPSAHVLAE